MYKTSLFVRFEVLAVGLIQIQIVCDVMPCQSENSYWCFTGACCLHLHCLSHLRELWRWKQKAPAK